MADTPKPTYLKNYHGRIVPLNAKHAEKLLAESKPGNPKARGFTKATAAEIKAYEEAQKTAREAASK